MPISPHRARRAGHCVRLRTAPVWVLLAALGLVPGVGRALPAPPPLRFVAPTPAKNSLVSTAAQVRLDVSCSFDEATLAVSLASGALDPNAFLPFSACSGGRKTSQAVTVSLPAPAGSILSAPGVVVAGSQASFVGSSSGDDLHWSFDGGAAPADGASVSPVFQAAGDFEVWAVATQSQALAASGMDGGNLVTAQRPFRAADPTPAQVALHVSMPPDRDFTNFESGHVHPIALSGDGSRVFAVNTPEARLALFDVEGDGSLSFADDVVVGLDPVSLAARPGTAEVWVVNHLSDSVSVVDTNEVRVLATIDVGDEPTDIVFASGRAFVSISGQRDAIVVIQASNRQVLATVDVFGDDPRALATNAAGTEVYAVVLESGNGTTTLFHDLVQDNSGPWGGGPPPQSPPRTAPGSPPSTGLIVQFDPQSGRWQDETGADWSSFVDFELPDLDLFVIDADAPTPSVIAEVPRIGTILFEVTARPGTDELFVPNLDSRNVVRFEPNLRGHLVQTRLSVVDRSAESVSATLDLNPHINYGITPGPPSEAADSLAHPGDGVFTSDGGTYYLSAFGSRKVARIDATTGQVTGRVVVGGGPSGVALNESAGRLYVLNRFDNTLSVVDTSGPLSEIDVVGIAGPAAFDPSPDVVKSGRLFLYDGELTSGHGDVACATCHIFGNFDNLAWDLGDPTGEFVSYSQAPWAQFFVLGASTAGFDPEKGPMTTQTLRGLEGMEPFHWRGDRENFQHFNGAFVSLLGTASELSTADMNAYTAFIETVRLPPNPYLELDGALPTTITVPDQLTGLWTRSANPSNGRAQFINTALDAGAFTCNQCHALPTGTNNLMFNGNAEGETQDFKIPHMRNMYEKVGFDVVRPNVLNGNASNIAQPLQKRGFGFLHDGSVSLTEFLAASVFTMNNQLERDMFAFSLALPTETAPCVGAQLQIDASNKGSAATSQWVSTVIGQAQAGSCDLIATGVVEGERRGYAWDVSSATFVPDSLLDTPLTVTQLQALIGTGDSLVAMGVPPGAGRRLAIDRDRDQWPDRGERNLGTDPADPNSNLWQNP